MAAPITREQLDAWEALAEKATPGPWGHRPADEGANDQVCGGEWSDELRDYPMVWEAWLFDAVQNPDDAAFIAAAREALPVLIARVKELEGRETRARIVADHWRRATLDWGEQPMPGRLSAHPLCCVLSALDGETDPHQFGVAPGEDFDALAALGDAP